MSDDLRTRIAAVLTTVANGRALYQMTDPDAAVMADAVIEELRLKYDCRYCGGWGPEHE